MFWMIVRGDSNKYPKQICEELRIKQGRPYIYHYVQLGFLTNSHFILMTTSLGTNTFIVTKSYCSFESIETMHLRRY